MDKGEGLEMEVEESVAPTLKISRFQERRGLREWQRNDPRQEEKTRLDPRLEEKKEKKALLQQMLSHKLYPQPSMTTISLLLHSVSTSGSHSNYYFNDY